MATQNLKGKKKINNLKGRRRIRLLDDSAINRRVSTNDAVQREITESNRAEVALRDSEERYRTLVENARDVIFTLSTTGTIISLNPAFEKITGWPRTEWIGKLFAPILHPDDFPIAADLFQRALRGEMLPIFELRVLLKSGGYASGEFTATPQIEKGRVKGILGIARDVTERKRAEELLRESEKKYRDFVDNAPIGIYKTDLNGNILFANQALSRMFEFDSPGQMISDGLLSRYKNPKDREILIRILKEKGKVTNHEIEVLTKSGKSLNVLLSATFEGGILSGMIKDITERKQAEEALSTEKQRFKTLSEQAPFGLVMINREGTFEYINPEFKELFGYDLSEVPDGRTWFRKAYPDPTYRHHVISDWLNDLERAKSGERRSKVFRATCKGGTEKIVHFISVQLERGEQLMTCEDITERKRTEEALRNSEERFRIAAKSSSDLIWDWDILNGRLEWFGNIDDRLGYDPGEFPRTIDAWEKIIHPDEHDRVMTALDQHLKMHKPYLEEYRVQRKDGTFCHWTDRGTAFWDEKGNPFKMVGACEDITERKQAEEALRESEEKYRILFEGSRDALYVTTRKGKLLKFNLAFLDLFGYSKEELAALNTRDTYVNPGDRYRFQQEIEQKGFVRDYEIKLRKKDGTEIDCLLTSSVWRDNDRNILGYQGIIRDITERKRAEDALRESEERYRTILENIEDGYYEVDLPGNFTFFNDSLCRMLGYSRDEMIGMGNQQYTDPENRKKLFQAFNEVYRTGKPAKGFDWEVIRKDGTKLFGEVSVSLIKDSKGQPIGFRGIARDITERKRAEQEISHTLSLLNATLESTADGILVVDRGGKILSFNQKFIQMWHIPESIIASEDDDQALAFVLDQLKDPEGFLAKIKQLYSQPEAGSFDLLDFKDGRVFERYSQPQWVGEQSVGRVWSFRDVTERKHAEEALQESEKKFRVLTETAASGIFIHQGGKFLYVNPASEAMTGYTREELLKMNFWDVVHPDFQKLVKERADARQRGKPVLSRYELKTITKNGEERWIDLTSGIIDFEGKPAVLGTSFDITERKAIENTAERIAQENAIMAEIGRIISSTLNIEEVYERFAEEVQKIIPFDRIVINIVNRQNNTATIAYGAGVDVPSRRAGDVLSLNGSGTEECMRKRSGFLIQNEDGEEVTRRFPGLLPSIQAGLRSLIFVPLISKDQFIGTLSLRSTRPKAYTDQDLRLTESIGDQIAGAIANAQLFNERKRAEEALRESELRFRDLFDNAPLGYHEYDAEGRVIKVNRTDEEMLGYTAKEMIGRFIWEFNVDEENVRQQVLAKLAGILPPGRNLERTYRRKDGTTFPVLIQDKLILDEKGKIKGIRCTIQDITEWKKAEEEVATLQEQLRQSQKIEAIGRLAGGIAHDFNNLLTVIKGYTQLSLLDLKENNPLWENMQEIQKATQRAADLTRQLLAFSRRQILDLKILDLNSLLKDMDKMLRRIIGEDIELVTLLSEDSGRVKIDPGQIEQVVFNLAVNARDAMPSGGKLTIETANVELDEEYAHTHIGLNPGQYVSLSLSDTGVGMSREVQEKAFEPFFTTKEKGKGTGLGLSTVYGIVKQSGGNIWAYSEVGRGTTFKIYLPRVEGELNTLQGQDETDSSPRGSETVLLVEDDPLVRDLANRLLKQQGYRVLEAANGEEALYVVQEKGGEKIHLLLTDVVLPQMGGKEIADQLNTLRPDIKVLYMSGYTDDAIVHHGVLDPGTHFLQKPFSLKTLSHKVREVLDT